MFSEGNFDEKSKILGESSAKFANIEVTFDIASGEAKLDTFKMPEGYITEFEKIINLLPGNENPIDFDPYINKPNP